MTIDEAFNRGLFKEGFRILTNADAYDVIPGTIVGKIISVSGKTIVITVEPGDYNWISTWNHKATVEFIDSKVKILKVIRFIVTDIIECIDDKKTKKYLKLGKKYDIKIGDTIKVKVLKNKNIYILAEDDYEKI